MHEVDAVSTRKKKKHCRKIKDSRRQDIKNTKWNDNDGLSSGLGRKERSMHHYQNRTLTKSNARSTYYRITTLWRVVTVRYFTFKIFKNISLLWRVVAVLKSSIWTAPYRCCGSGQHPASIHLEPRRCIWKIKFKTHSILIPSFFSEF